MATYSFTAFTEADLLQGVNGSSIGTGDTFIMPALATTEFTVSDDDSRLSGDYYSNEVGDDTSGQTADITVNGQQVFDDAKIYAESYHVLQDQYGNYYYLVEIEIAGGNAPGTGDDFFTFYGSVPPEGAQLSVVSTYNVTCDWVSFQCLGAGDMAQPGSIGGRFTYDADANDNEWNDQTGTWDQGIAGATVQLIDSAGNVVATDVTDSYGNYRFDLVMPGEYRVQFPPQPGKEFSAKDSGVAEHYDSDANENGLTDPITVSSGQHIWNIDAGVKSPPEPENSAPDAVDDAFTTDENTTVTGNLLANDSDPDGDPISVVAIEGGSVGESFQVTTAKGFTGTVTVQEDGTFTFDPDDNFKALSQGETDSFELTYTIADDPSIAGKHNILLVIDISNSTVGISGQNAFDGTGVGDVNNDGRADTVLDAQIVAARALIDDLRSKGLDASKINIGIVTFSGVDTTGASSYNNATVDSEVVGTFNLDDTGIDSALDGILSGSWTNYEAGLSEAEGWFGATAGAGDKNAMFFLSDGRPITGYDYTTGQYVEQNTSQFLDEVGRIEANFGADIHAIGVGANSSLSILDQIDNTGGAIQVTDAASLTSAMLDTDVTSALTDTATVTVTINGLNEGPVAVNDALVTDEATAKTINILANDSDPEGDALTITSIGGNATGTSFAVTTTAGRTGTVTVDAAGNLTFDPGTGFEDLNNAQTDSFQISYTISDGQFTDTATVTVTVNGIGDPVDAVNDAYTINEDQDIAANLLDNDTPNDGSLSVVGVAEDGVARTVGESFTVTTDAGRTGTVTVGEDGAFTFDGGDNFLEMAQGETDTFDLTYTVEGAATAGEVPKHNILFIIDISGSTSPATFAGSPVGDQNGDGVANSVLDAEIAAYKALSAQIAASGLTDDKVDIGLIAFSGNNGTNQTGASQFLGTFKPGASGLDTALEGLTDGGFTNFEAPLQTGIAWFEDQAATTDDKNIVYFLSDGMQNVGGTFDDESAELANRFGAELNAVGVGTNAVLGQLNVIDNTGGAEIVTTSDELTAALVDTAPEVPGDQDTATVTVTINGLNEGPLAVNDALVTDEATAKTINILANDSDPEGDALTITSIGGNATGTSFAVTTTAGRTGTVTVDAAGNLTFDPGTGFEDLYDDESDGFTLTYTITDGQFSSTATVFVTVDGLGARNAAPVANPDALVTDEDTAKTINILTNDTDADNDPLSVVAIQGGTIGTAFSVTTTAGRTGLVTVLADGTFTFDPAAGFEDLDDGQSDTFTLGYTASDGTASDVSTVTVTVNGITDPNVLEDEGEATTVDEGSGVTTLLNVLDNTIDPEPGAPIVGSVNGSLFNIGQQVAGDQGGLFTINADGTASFDTNGDFTGLNDGESKVTTVTYEAVDQDGARVTSVYEVTILGSGTPTQTVDILGNVITQRAATSAIAIIVDVSSDAAGGFLGLTPFDLNNDFSANTALDYMLAKVAEFAATLDDAQEIALISQSAMPIQTVTAGAIKAALLTGGDTGVDAFDIDADDAVALQGIFGGIQADGFVSEIDFETVLLDAETYLTGKGADNNEVLVLTATDGADGTNSDGSPNWIGGNPLDEVARLSNPSDPANTDINVVLIESGGFVNQAALEQIDNEGNIDVIDQFGDPASLNTQLADLVDLPTVIDVGDVVEVKVDGTPGLGTITPTGDGFAFELTDLEIALGATPEVKVTIDDDGVAGLSAGDTQYNVTQLGLLNFDDTTDTFSFTLDALSLA